MVRSFLSRLFARAPCTSRNAMVSRLALEALDERLVPATDLWTDATGDGLFSTAANWQSHEIPQTGDALEFEGPIGTYTSGPCTGLSGSFSSITVTATYASTITLSGAVTTGTLSLAGGTIDQPATGEDITVTGSFTWTGGTLNSTANLATLHVQGLSTTIAPGAANTVTTGDTLSLENGSSTMVTAGTINFNNLSTLNEDSTSNLTVDTSLGNVTFADPNKTAPTPTSTINNTVIIEGKNTDEVQQNVRVNGTLQIIGGATYFVNSSPVGVGNLASISLGQIGTLGLPKGIVTIQNGSTLKVSNAVVVGSGGLLQSYVDPNGNKTDQRKEPATIAGDVEIQGGQITVDANSTNPHIWGLLTVTGNGTWTAGIINLTIDPKAANLNMDQISFLGTFQVTVTLDPKTGNPVANSPTFNVITTAPAKAQVWKGIITAKNGITFTTQLPTANNGLTVTEETKVGGKVLAWDFQS